MFDPPALAPNCVLLAEVETDVTFTVVPSEPITSLFVFHSVTNPLPFVTTTAFAVKAPGEEVFACCNQTNFPPAICIPLLDRFPTNMELETYEYANSPGASAPSAGELAVLLLLI